MTQEQDGGAMEVAEAQLDAGTYCQVPSCTSVPQEGEARYYRRFRICRYHANLAELPLGGRRVRFCQQCGRFQPVEDFEGVRKSCRESLGKHNARRRRKAAGGSGGNSAATLAAVRSTGLAAAAAAAYHPGNQHQPGSPAGLLDGGGLLPPPGGPYLGPMPPLPNDLLPPLPPAEGPPRAGGFPPLSQQHQMMLLRLLSGTGGGGPASGGGSLGGGGAGLGGPAPPPFGPSYQPGGLLAGLGDGPGGLTQNLLQSLASLSQPWQPEPPLQPAPSGPLPLLPSDLLPPLGSNPAGRPNIQCSPTRQARGGEAHAGASAQGAGQLPPQLNRQQEGRSLSPIRDDDGEPPSSAWPPQQPPAAQHSSLNDLLLPPQQLGSPMAAAQLLLLRRQAQLEQGGGSGGGGSGESPPAAAQQQQHHWQVPGLPQEQELPPSPLPPSWKGGPAWGGGQWPGLAPGPGGGVDIPGPQEQGEGRGPPHPLFGPGGPPSEQQLPPNLQAALERVSNRWFQVSADKLAPHVREGVIQLIKSDPEFADLAAPPGSGE